MGSVFTLRTAIILCTTSLATACFGHTLGSVEINSCADGTHQGASLQTPALVIQGNVYLDSALRELGKPDILDVEAPLRQASGCFGRALRLTPESYEAQLSMSVVYLAHARLAPERSSERTSLLAGARHLLGRAYMVRHGAYEPLYYLAEVAVAEGDLTLARRLLEPLRVASVKEGPVNMLLGMLSEREGKPQDAVAFYRRAATAGWPAEAVIFAAGRIQDLGEDGRKTAVSNALNTKVH